MYFWRKKMRCSIHMLILYQSHGMFICNFLAKSYNHKYINSTAYIKENNFVNGNLNFRFIA